MPESPSANHVEFDADLDAWTIDLEPPGPAGTAALQISPGLRLLVDIAEPDRIGAVLTNEAPGGLLDAQHLSPVAGIFGSGVLDVLGGRAWRGQGRRRPVPPDDLAEVRLHLARLAIAEDAATDATDELIEAVASAEAALLAEILQDAWSISVTRRTSTATVSQRLISECARNAERITAAAHDRFTDLLLGLAPYSVTAIAAELRSLGEDIARRNATPNFEAVAWQPRATAVGQLDLGELEGSTRKGHVRLDRRLFSTALLDPSARGEAVWHPLDGDLTVLCRVTPGAYLVGLRTHWVRVYRPETGVLLALAPLEPIRPTGDEQWAEARLHVGGQDPATLAVDVTAAPNRRPPSILRRTIDEAIRTGSDAARFERVAAASAIDAWEACAQIWQVADDPDREAIASARAANLARAAGQEERVSVLDAKRSRLPVTWAANRLDPRWRLQPLVADFLVSGNVDSTTR